MTPRRTSVLVLGGAGFVGTHLARHLSAAGRAVTVLHRGPRPASLPPGVAFARGDRDVRGDLEAALRSAQPEVVVDLLAHTAGRAELLANAFGGRVARLVVTSSVDVYRAWARFQGLEPGPPEPTPLGLEAPLRETRFPRRALAHGPEDWRWDYDKIEVETCLRGVAGLPVVVVRLPYVWGPGDRRQRLAPYLAPLGSGARRVGLPAPRARWRATRMYVEHVAADLTALVDAPAPPSLCQLGDPAPLSELEWARAVARAAGWLGEVVATPPSPGARSGGEDWSQDLVLALAPQAPRPPGWLDTALKATLAALGPGAVLGL